MNFKYIFQQKYAIFDKILNLSRSAPVDPELSHKRVVFAKAIIADLGHKYIMSIQSFGATCRRIGSFFDEESSMDKRLVPILG